MRRLVHCVIVTMAVLAPFEPALAEVPEVPCDNSDKINCVYDARSENGWIINGTGPTAPDSTGSPASYPSASNTSGSSGYCDNFHVLPPGQAPTREMRESYQSRRSGCDDGDQVACAELKFNCEEE